MTTLSLLDLDPELGALVPEGLRPSAHRELFVAVARVPAGVRDTSSIRGADPLDYGLFIGGGMLARNIVIVRSSR